MASRTALLLVKTASTNTKEVKAWKKTNDFSESMNSSVADDPTDDPTGARPMALNRSARRRTSHLIARTKYECKYFVCDFPLSPPKSFPAFNSGNLGSSDNFGNAFQRLITSDYLSMMQNDGHPHIPATTWPERPETSAFLPRRGRIVLTNLRPTQLL
jgi:hypothetical protein